MREYIGLRRELKTVAHGLILARATRELFFCTRRVSPAASQVGQDWKISCPSSKHVARNSASPDSAVRWKNSLTTLRDTFGGLNTLGWFDIQQRVAHNRWYQILGK